jgi:hypothetical protein
MEGLRLCGIKLDYERKILASALQTEELERQTIWLDAPAPCKSSTY